MSRVTAKDVIEYYKSVQEYFPSRFTVAVVKRAILNSDYTPAELLHMIEAKVERIKAKRLAKAQEEAVQEEAAKFNADLETKEQLVNQINDKADLAQSIIETPLVDPVVEQNKRAVSKIIREIDLNTKTAFFKFARGSKAKFNELKPEIIDLINRFKPASDLFVKVYYKVDGKSIPKPTTFSLGNNIGMQKMQMLLDGKTYELIEKSYDPNGQNKKNPNRMLRY